MVKELLAKNQGSSEKLSKSLKQSPKDFKHIGFFERAKAIIDLQAYSREVQAKNQVLNN